MASPTCSNPGPDGRDSDAGPDTYSLCKFLLYETPARFYLVGRDCSRMRWRVLKIDRSEPADLSIHEDPAVYSKQECNDLLNRLDKGNRSNGGLNFVTKAYGIVGFIKFLEPYYMILVTKRRAVGTIRGHMVYGIDESQILTIQHSSARTNLGSSQVENRYKKLFSSIDLTKDFFYSSTYRLMWSLQNNILKGEAEGMPFEDMFVWNSFLTRGIRQQVRSMQWTLALMHGFFKQSKLYVRENLNLVVTLIARRSRHYAGTRYLKRGLNKRGRVANDVETEQIVYEEGGNIDHISSVVQHRGSIPLYWSQETSVLSPRPDIQIYKHDPKYEATMLHFLNLTARYGNPIIVLNLVKTCEKKPRETILSSEFGKAVAFLNQLLPKDKHINYAGWDFHMSAKRSSTNVVEVLGSIAKDVLNMTGFYCSTTKAHQKGELTEREEEKNGSNEMPIGEREKCVIWQQGVLRSNCIDCIDRTNVAQYAFGLVALGRQIFSLGLSHSSQIHPDSRLAFQLMEMYEKMGDILGIQYGGSAAHNKVFSQRRGKWKATTQYQEFFRSMKRHYNNAYLDGEKQDAINIFLGHFRPKKGKSELWLLDLDNYLHIRRHGEDPLNDGSLSLESSFSDGNMTQVAQSSDVLLECTGKFATLAKDADSIDGSRHLNSCESLRNISDAEFEEANPFTPSNPSNENYNEQRFGDVIEDDWPSSGNSFEEEDSERKWNGMGSETVFVLNKKKEVDSKQGRQEAASINLWKIDNFDQSAIGEYLTAGLSERDRFLGKAMDAANTDHNAKPSVKFLNWVNCGQTLCH